MRFALLLVAALAFLAPPAHADTLDRVETARYFGAGPLSTTYTSLDGERRMIPCDPHLGGACFDVNETDVRVVVEAWDRVLPHVPMAVSFATADDLFGTPVYGCDRMDLEVPSDALSVHVAVGNGVCDEMAWEYLMATRGTIAASFWRADV